MNKALDMISKLCCFIFSTVLFFVIFFYLLLNIGTKIINKDNVIEIVSNLDIEMIIDKDELNETYEEFELTEKDKKITYGVINSKEFKGLLGKYLGNVVELVLYDKQNEKITKEEVINIIEDKIDYVSNQYGISLTYGDKQSLINSLEGEINELVNQLSNEQEILNELTEEEITSIRFFFGNGLKTILLIVVAVIVVLIAIFRWSLYRFAIWTGVTTIISGAFFAGCGSVLSSILQEQMLGNISVQLITILEKNVFSVITKTGLIVIIIGVVQVIYYYILKKGNENVKV